MSRNAGAELENPVSNFSRCQHIISTRTQYCSNSIGYSHPLVDLILKQIRILSFNLLKIQISKGGQTNSTLSNFLNAFIKFVKLFFYFIALLSEGRKL